MTSILEKYANTRQHTVDLCSGLQAEDFNLQGAAFTSPVKWHLAHTTWFFEEMILKKFHPDYKVFDEDYSFLFNSYYNTLGDRVLRHNRGLLSRPYVSEILNYRNHVDHYIKNFSLEVDNVKIMELLILGIQHEEQHQELLQTDVKFSLSLNPYNHKLIEDSTKTPSQAPEEAWLKVSEGLYDIGHQGESFCFDNELSQHKVFLRDFEISKNLVTNKEFIEFIEDSGYSNFNLWLDEGWAWVSDMNLKAPLYWKHTASGWMEITPGGMISVDPNDPVKHVSFYEAMAFATWKGNRLPTEFEWEAAADKLPWGKRWEWTNSAYLPYPGFEIAAGAVGEYNGKFMSNQMVLRGASQATSSGHSRKSYRNFFHPTAQWQFSGIRLVKE